MKAELTTSEIWCNAGFPGFFLFEKSFEKLRLLLNASIDVERTTRAIDERFETVEEMNQWLFDEDLETIKGELMSESYCPFSLNRKEPNNESRSYNVGNLALSRRCRFLSI